MHIIIIISFISLALKDMHKRLGLYNVLTHSQGDLEAYMYIRICIQLYMYFVCICLVYIYE